MIKSPKIQGKFYDPLSFELQDKLPFHEEVFDLIEGLPAAIYICDKEGKITFYNSAAAELWGRKPVIGKDYWCGSWKIYHTDGSPMLIDACPMAVTLRTGKPIHGQEIVVERPDGVRVNVLPHPKPLFDESGNIVGAVNMLVDITEKKHTEQLLRESEKKYRLLSESLERKVEERTLTLKHSEERYHKMIEEVQEYAILLLDKDGTILNWNRGAEKIKGYKEKEIVGKNFREFYLPEDRASKLPEKLIEEAQLTGKARHEGWRLKKDRTKFWGSIVITALHDEENNIIGFSKVTRDLTERKLAEDRLKQYAHEIEVQNSQLEEYVYVASHDLQEPLRKIQTFCELLGKNIDDKEKANRFLDKIISSSKRMSVLIKDVLRYSQLAKSDELFTSIDLNKVLQSVEEDFDLLIDQKNAVIKSTTLPVVQGVPIQFYQLFSNLIGNSLKFSSKNPEIDISCEKATEEETLEISQLKPDKSYFKLIFKDNGIGFESQYAEQIFKLFHRLNSAKIGTGIGLALCKKIVENHKGHISVSSEPGKGSEFNVFLPVD